MPAPKASTTRASPSLIALAASAPVAQRSAALKITEVAVERGCGAFVGLRPPLGAFLPAGGVAVGAGVVLVGAIVWLRAATPFAAHDWASGSVSNQLLFELGVSFFFPSAHPES